MAAVIPITTMAKAICDHTGFFIPIYGRTHPLDPPLFKKREGVGGKFFHDFLYFRPRAKFENPNTKAQDNHEQNHQDDSGLSHSEIFETVFKGHDIQGF